MIKKFPPLLIVLLNIGFMYWCWHLHLYFIDRIYGLFLFTFFLTLSLVTLIASLIQFKANKTSVNPLNPKPSKLVVKGVYKFSRNPMYLGMVLLQISFFFLFRTIYNLAFPILFILLMNKFQIKKEEEVLGNSFGNEYKEYCSRTRRWI